MEFLYSNIPPLKTGGQSFYDVFYSLIPESIRIDIAVGYVTADSLAELKQAIILNDNIETLNLIIGMHRWEKFTKMEYNSALELNNYLRSNNRGEVRLVIPFRFHGKIYTYSDKQGAFAGIIGSNNLSGIVDSRTRIYEVSSLFKERNYAVQLHDFIERLSSNAAENIDDCNIIDFKEHNLLLEDHENVEKISHEKLADCISSITAPQFTIPLVKKRKVPQQSNLNTFFGKGRINKNGLIKPRHWYETELIVPKNILQMPEYPKIGTPSAVFNVITDDGWKFACKVSGDFGKNLRSADDLKILGKWIKGRLENAGALQVGQLVTIDTFNQYGRDNFTLSKIADSDLWYLDFGVN